MFRNNGRHNFRSPILSQGPQSSFTQDFAGTQSLGLSVTFTRSTTATYTNSSGVLTYSPINSPRFDYNPTTLQSLGLYVEEARTNILLNSLLNGTNLSTQTVTTTATPYTLSFYGAGTIVLSGTNISTQAGTGAYPSRKTYTFTPTAGSLILTVTGTVQYAQLEAGSSVSSFIPTAGAQATRTSDYAFIDGTSFSSFYNQSEGTFLVYADTVNPSAQAMLMSTGASSGRPSIYVNGGQSAAGLDSVYEIKNGTVVANTSFNAAFAYKANNSALTLNATTPTTSANPTAPASANTLYLGNRNNAVFLNGHLSKVTYYSTRLTNAQLQALTT
jgi:hypothetical protein